MGMGASCARVDCVASVEECTRQAQSLGSNRPKVFWQDCGGSQSHSPGANSPRNSGVEDAAALSKSLELEAEAQLSFDQFAVHHGSGGPISSWRRRYILGRELGSGQTATVFEAFATAPGIEDNAESGYMRSPRADELSGQWPCGESSGFSPSQASTGTCRRRVALKRFHQEGTMMFQQELKALLAVGVHPHVVRLLESFESSGEDDDVIVLEHCDGGDVYELYAANNGCCMLESFVRQLIRQLLLALQHLQERCIEHRDVKPENLLLFTTSMDGKSVPFLKLADFGWATIVSKLEPGPTLPPEGVGSLWYAPPELNPPVNGMEVFVDDLELGKSDIWSVGIITYLLLTGHSPFNAALKVKDPVAREAEVIRLAALGDVNTSTKVWNSMLSEEAKSFILALIRPNPAKRLSPAEALSHPFMTIPPEEQVDAGRQGQIPPPFPPENAAGKWQRLDSFQKLCWLALARAATEPELVEVSLLQAFVHVQGNGSAGYLERLAAKLVSVASPAWFQPEAAWGDMLYLAFLYLDINGDGFLSVDDLRVHFAGGKRSREIADNWICKWRSNGQQPLPLGASYSLSFSDFRRVFISSITSVDVVAPPAGAGALDSKGEIMIQHRMRAIEQVCSRFLEEEAENSGAGL